jgi:tetratricopeptide (TPR) repeat protein
MRRLKLLKYCVFLAVLGGCKVTPRGDPAKSANRLELAKDALERRDVDAAEAEANRSIAYLGTNEEAFMIRGLAHFFRAVKAERALEVDGCMTGVDAEAMRRDLDAHLEAARRDFEHATRLAPDYGEAWSNLGTIANLEGDHVRAIDQLSRGLQHPSRLVDPVVTRAHLGWARFHTGDHPEAVKEFLLALQFRPGHCLATYRLGRVYFAREEWEKAAEQFQGVTDQPSCGSQEASLYLMRTRAEQGLVEDAKQARDACIQMAPRSCIAAQCRTEGTRLP